MKSIVLLSGPVGAGKTTIARAAARSEGKIPDYSTYSEFYADFGGMELNTISDDKSDAAVIAKRIRKGLDQGTFRLVS